MWSFSREGKPPSTWGLYPCVVSSILLNLSLLLGSCLTFALLSRRTPVKKVPKQTKRKPRGKREPELPQSFIKNAFRHYARMPVAKDAFKAVEKWWVTANVFHTSCCFVERGCRLNNMAMRSSKVTMHGFQFPESPYLQFLRYAAVFSWSPSTIAVWELERHFWGGVYAWAAQLNRWPCTCCCLLAEPTS